MNIEQDINILKQLIREYKRKPETQNEFFIGLIEERAIENLLTAYKEEKGENVKLRLQDIPLIEGELKAYKDRVNELKQELEKEKEKNKNIDEFCRKELAFERRLKRENGEPDEFNQGRFYVSENIRKIIEEE